MEGAIIPDRVLLHRIPPDKLTDKNTPCVYKDKLKHLCIRYRHVPSCLQQLPLKRDGGGWGDLKKNFHFSLCINGTN